MGNIWVDRDGSNKIITTYGTKQERKEKLLDEDSEVIAFLAPPPDKPRPPTNKELEDRIKILESK